MQRSSFARRAPWRMNDNITINFYFPTFYILIAYFFFQISVLYFINFQNMLQSNTLNEYNIR